MSVSLGSAAHLLAAPVDRELALFVFCFGIAWLVYIYAGYPLLVGLWSLVRWVRPIVRDDYLPGVSVLIAARNEEKDIAWKVSETLAWDYPSDRLEVLVASDASEDRTDEIVLSIRDSRLTFLRMEKRAGKNLALNRLAALARGEILFFTDANAHIEPGCLRKLVRHFADKRVGCVTGDTHPVMEGANAALGNGAKLYWDYESVNKRMESRVGLVLVCDGSIFCIRRSLFTPLLPELANDLELPLRISHAGYWTLYEPEAYVLEKDTNCPAEEFARRRRICAQGMIGMWKLRHTLRGMRGWQFFSLKFLRWLTLAPLVLLFFASVRLARNPVFAGFVGLQVLFYSLALLGWILTLVGRAPLRIVAVPFYVVLVGAAGLVGVAEACFGRRFAVWDIPTLSRGREAISQPVPELGAADRPISRETLQPLRTRSLLSAESELTWPRNK